MIDRFTRVLKGHIAIATAVFPKGTRGSQLDSFARRPLWEAGLDYAHGTGHGVGSFLSVRADVLRKVVTALRALPVRVALNGGNTGCGARASGNWLVLRAWLSSSRCTESSTR